MYHIVKVLMVNRITRGMLMFGVEDVKFEKLYNFSGNTIFERLLLDLLNIRTDISY